MTAEIDKMAVTGSRQSFSRLVGRYDMVLMTAVLALTGLGLLLVFSTTVYPGADLTDAERLGLFLRQSLAVGIGVIAMFALRVVRPETFGRVALILLIGFVALIFLMKFAGLGTERGGSPRWIRFAGFSLQPSEMVKVVWAVWVARYVARHETDVNKWLRLVVIFLFCVGAAAPFVALPDIGTALILGLMMAVALYSGGLSYRKILTIAIPILVFLVLVVVIDEVKRNRLLAYIFLDITREGVGYQLYQAVITIGSGGMFGKGLGHGTFHIMRHLPFSESDFIVSVAGEELGFVGLFFIVTLYTVIAIRGYRIARICVEPFRRNLAFLITVLLIMSAAIHFCVNVALIPAKGLVCPFLSQGGTAMIMAFAAIGILQRLHIDATARKVVTEEYLSGYGDEPEVEDGGEVPA